MKILHFFGRSQAVKPSSTFSKFFLEKSSGEKKKVILEAARQANEDQREVFYGKKI